MLRHKLSIHMVLFLETTEVHNSESKTTTLCSWIRWQQTEHTDLCPINLWSSVFPVENSSELLAARLLCSRIYMAMGSWSSHNSAAGWGTQFEDTLLTTAIRWWSVDQRWDKRQWGRAATRRKIKSTVVDFSWRWPMKLSGESTVLFCFPTVALKCNFAQREGKVPQL